ncbi:MAG: hypothetical protein AMXMBFR33_07150 [Candidatus Xenobia bacterium]
MTSALLIGRSSDLEVLAGLCRSDRGVGLLLVGASEIGRSSVMGELAEQLRSSRKVLELGPNTCVGELLEALAVKAEHPTRPASLAGALRRGLAGSQCVLLVDDFERLDSLTRRTLEQLARLTPPAGSSWIISVTPPAAVRFPRCARQTLPPLSNSDMSTLIRMELKGEPGESLEEWLVARSGGSPRRLRLLALILAVTGLLKKRGGQLEASRLPTDPMADVLSALESLDEDARLLLELGCLADEPFSFEVLVHASGLSRDRAERAARLLSDGGLLEGFRIGPTELRKLVSTGLPDRTRRRHHGRLADALEALAGTAAERGRQLARAGKSSDAAWLLMEAGRQAHDRGLLEEALQLWETAASCLLLGDPIPGVARADTLLALGRAEEAERALARLNDSPEVRRAQIDALIAREEWDEAGRLCEQALETTPTKGELELRLARVLTHRGDREGAIAALERALPEVGPEARLSLGRLSLATGDVRRLRASVQPLLEHPELRFEALLLLAEGEQMGGRGSAGRERLQEAAALANQEKVPEREARVHLLQAGSLRDEGDLVWAAEACEQAVTLLRPAGESLVLTEALEQLLRLRLEQNKPSEAETVLRELVAVSDVLDESGPRARARLRLGRLQIENGRAAEAVDSLSQAAELARGSEQAEILTVLATAKRLQGNSQEAIAVAEQAVTRAREAASSELLAASLVTVGELSVDAQQWSRAREALEEARGLLPEDPGLSKALARLHEQGALHQVPGLSAEEARRIRRTTRTRAQLPVNPRRILPWLGAAVALALFMLWPRPGIVQVESHPPGAAVVVDGKRHQAPCTLKLSPGSHEVKVALQGYKSHVERVELSAGQSFKLVARLESASGAVRFSTQPKGARIYLEGRLKGVSPLELKGLPPRRFQVLVVKPGYLDYLGAVDVVAGKTRNLSVNLKQAR